MNGNCLTINKLLNGKIVVGERGCLKFFKIKDNYIQDEFTEDYIHDKEITCIQNKNYNNKNLIITSSLDNSIKFFEENK